MIASPLIALGYFTIDEIATEIEQPFYIDDPNSASYGDVILHVEASTKETLSIHYPLETVQQ